MEKLRKVRDILRSRYMRASVLASLCVMALCVGAFAEGETGDSYAVVQSAFETGFQTMVDKALAMIAVIVPIALGLAGVLFLVRKAMSWFRSVAH